MSIVTNFNTSSSIQSSLAYGSQDYKSGYEISANCNSRNAVRDFRMPFEVNNRSGDTVKLHRFVLSFANDSKGKCEVNRSDSKRYAEDFMSSLDDKLGHRFPIYAVENVNTNHEHWHFYIGACSSNGQKFHPTQSPLYMCRKINDELSEKYDLRNIRDYRQRSVRQFTEENRRRFSLKHGGEEPYSYYSDARQKISRAILLSHDLSTFTKAMNLQGCRVRPNFFDNTKTGSVEIPYSHKDKNKNCSSDPDFRKVRTRTLGSDFEKDKLKKAISDNSLRRRYIAYAQPRKDVQGGLSHFPAILTPTMSHEHTTLSNMNNVPYKDSNFNHLFSLKDKMDNFKFDYGFSSIKPNIEGLSSKDREILLLSYKNINKTLSLINDMFSSNNNQSIISSFTRRHFYNFKKIKKIEKVDNSPHMQFDYSNNNNHNDTYDDTHSASNIRSDSDPLSQFSGKSLRESLKIIQDHDNKRYKSLNYERKKFREDFRKHMNEKERKRERERKNENERFNKIKNGRKIKRKGPKM